MLTAAYVLESDGASDPVHYIFWMAFREVKKKCLGLRLLMNDPFKSLVTPTPWPLGLRFTKNPANLTVTQGNMVRLGCSIEGLREPEIVWMKDGEKLYSTDQMYIPLEQHHWETFHRSVLQ